MYPIDDSLPVRLKIRKVFSKNVDNKIKAAGADFSKSPVFLRRI